MRGTIGVALASVLAALCFAAAAGGGDSVRVEVVHSPFLHGTLLILPGWYGDHDNPAIPVVLAPHPPGRPADAVASFWRDYPARGGFAVLSPALTDDVVGGRLAFLAHVRKYAMLAVPWLRLDSTRIYAFGSGVVARSLLLLAARYPWAIEGVAAADPIFDLPAPGSRSPSARQPSAFLRDLAFARVPLQIWSPNGDDALAAALKRADPRAPVVQARGGWAHDLSVALLGFGLLPLPGSSQRIVAEPAFLGSSKPFGSTDFPGASSCRSRPGALSYGWPVAPFDQPHPVRGGFGDPRTVFGLVSPDDPNPRGTFSFHNGVDISADPGTPVYPVLSGVAQFVGKGEVDVRTGDGRVFRYIHIIPQIELGDRVRKDETVLGTVEQRAGHVHLSEVMNGRIVNPLAPGHLTPWTDDTTPVVHDVAFTDPLTGKPVDPEHLSGSVAIAAAAYDSPPIAVPGRWYGMPIAPALVAWQLTSAKTGKPVIRDRVAADFRRGIPDEKYFWDYYAHGTYQNFPAVGLHYFAKTPGRFLFRLTHQPLDTLLVPAGDYDLTVDASDICGNTGSLATRVHVEAQPGQVEPAPPKPKPVPKPVPKPKVEVVPAPQPAKPRPQDLMHWPRLRGGYTVVLASIPRDRGERYAVHEARAALANGASRVGVLDTSRFPGLSRGFRVVFSGVYPDAGAASRAATSLAGSYPQAYVREIAPPILSWPRRRSAWTVVLASVPAGRGAHEGAHRKATEASALGLPRVGILETSRFRSLKRGYLVVYSGVYRTQERAQEAARRASGRFPNAYARWISAAR